MKFILKNYSYINSKQICTFGGNKKTTELGNKGKSQTLQTSNKVVDNTGKSGIAAMSEELRDEHINKKLNDALQLKNQGDSNEEALKIYQEIINLEFLKESKIDKHVFMKFNAFKNMGELYERVSQYYQAKFYYTLAIKIREKDAFIWTRLGFMEYEHFKNFPLSKQCFEIAAQCYSTIQRRSSLINPILMKMAEIAFSEYDFKTSERMVDSITQRVQSSQQSSGNMMGSVAQQNLPKQLSNPEVFAYLLKSYFLSLRGDDDLSKVFLQKAQKLYPKSNYADVEVISKFLNSVSNNLNSKDLVIRQQIVQVDDNKNKTVENQFNYLRQLNTLSVIQIKPTKEHQSFMEYFDDFLLQLAQTCEGQTFQMLQNSILDCEAFVPIMSEFFQLFNNNPSFPMQYVETLSQYQEQLLQRERRLTNQESQPGGTQTKQGAQATLASNPTTSKRGGANTQGANPSQQNPTHEPKRQLRRKLDTTEQQLKQYNLKPLKDFKEYIINDLTGIRALDILLDGQNQDSQSQGFSDQDLEVIYSHSEIIKAKAYLTQDASLNVIGTSTLNNQFMENNNFSTNNAVQEQCQVDTIIETYWKFLGILQKIQNKNVLYVIRNMLRFLIDTQLNSQIFLNYENSSLLYRLFLVSIGNDLTMQNLDGLGSFSVVLTLFEMSLFNQEVVKHVKSNQLITQRDKLYEYFAQKEYEYFSILDRETKRIFENLDSSKPQNGKHLSPQQVEILKIRFYHSMMFYSFEIKNDMHSSIAYYHKIDDKSNVLQNSPGGKVCLYWVSTSFSIDEGKLVQYGSCKIKEAQVVKDQDETLIGLKQQELDEAKKGGNQRTITNKIKPEFTNLAGFYLDQLCQYLQKAYQSESSVNANFSTNEEKIKEMWNKLQYTVCRCDSLTLIRVSSHLFSIMTAFQSIQKQFYDNFILKKLEFEPLITEICERFRQSFNQLMDFSKNNPYQTLQDLQQPLLNLLQNLLPIYQIENFTISNCINWLVKMEINLLRLLNNEFLYFHIVQNQFRFGDQLLYSYFSLLYYIEMFATILRAKPDDDLTTQMQSITKLVKQIDKLCFKNGEIFIRSYFRFLTLSLPPTLSFFINHLECSKTQTSNQNSLQSKETQVPSNYYRSSQYLNDNNDLLQLLITLSQYFFDIKFTVKDLQKSQQQKQLQNNNNISKDMIERDGAGDSRVEQQLNSSGSKKQQQQVRSNNKKGADEEMKDVTKKQQQQQDQQEEDEDDEEESEDEKKNYMLKMVYKLKTNQQKMWSFITSTNWIPKTTQPLTGITNQQLTYLYQQVLIDVTLLKDLLSLCSIMSCERISQCGQLVKKDVASMTTLLDIVGRYMQDNLKQYFDKCQKAQQMLSCFKEAMTNNPFRFVLKVDAKCTCLIQNNQGNNKQCLQDNLKQRGTVQKLLRLFMNVASHMCIENSPYQFVTQSGKRRLNLGESLYSLNQGGHLKLMKNLKRLSQLDTIYSGFNVESLLVFCQIQTEFYNLGNLQKLNNEYKEKEYYKSYKQLYSLIQNTVLIALSSIRTSLITNNQSEKQSANSQLWSNMTDVKLIKLCLTQMITLISLKLHGKKFIQKRVNPTAERQDQIINLKQQICALCLICEKLDRASIAKEDPRFGLNSISNLQTTARDLLDKLFSVIQQSNKGLNEKMSFKLNPELYDQFVTDVNQAAGGFRSGIDASKWKISFDYPLLKTILGRQNQIHDFLVQREYLNKTKDELDDLLDPILRFQYLKDVSACIQMAYNAQSLNGCIECFIILIRGGLELGLLLKYDENKVSKDEIQQIKVVYETVTKTLLGGNRQIFKFIHNKLVPLSQTYSNQSKFASNNQGSDAFMSGNEDDERERSILLDDKTSSSLQRPIIFATNDIPQFNEYESTLHQLYLFGDRLFNIMALLQARQWQKIRLQYGLVSALKDECRRNQMFSPENPSQEIFTRLRDMMLPVITQLNYIEDNYLISGVPNYYSDETPSNTLTNQQRPQSQHSQIWLSSKNLLTLVNQNEFALAEIRIKVREFYLELNQEIQQYENIKDMYKRQMPIQKQLENLQKNGVNLNATMGFSVSNLSSNPQTNQMNSCLALVKSIEVQYLFKLIKDKLIETHFEKADKQVKRFLELRFNIISQQSKKANSQFEQQLYNNHVNEYKSFKEVNSTTKDHIPSQLKDIFEIFVDSHMKKGVLNYRKLIDEHQKRTIRQALLKFSAYCGPDPDFTSILLSQNENDPLNDEQMTGGKTTSKFLDLDRITDEEYEHEGLLICLKWYMNILEERSNVGTTLNQEKGRAPSGSKIDQDLYKKLKITYEEIDRSIKEQQQRQLSEQQMQLALVQGGQSFIPADASIATKVFDP